MNRPFYILIDQAISGSSFFNKIIIIAKKINVYRLLSMVKIFNAFAYADDIDLITEKQFENFFCR